MSLPPRFKDQRHPHAQWVWCWGLEPVLPADRPALHPLSYIPSPPLIVHTTPINFLSPPVPSHSEIYRSQTSLPCPLSPIFVPYPCPLSLWGKIIPFVLRTWSWGILSRFRFQYSLQSPLRICPRMV